MSNEWIILLIWLPFVAYALVVAGDAGALHRFWNDMKDALRSILMVFVRPFQSAGNLAQLQPGEIVITEYEARQKRLIEKAVEGSVFQPSLPLEPWTPMERIALGIDDNEKWILETQRTLNEIEWQQIRSLHTHDQGASILEEI